VPATQRAHTIGAVARHFNVAVWQVRRVILRGLLPEPDRIGAYRVFTTAELPKVKAALIKAGYLRAKGKEAADAV
jgi:hypothetical protein